MVSSSMGGGLDTRVCCEGYRQAAPALKSELLTDNIVARRDTLGPKNGMKRKRASAPCMKHDVSCCPIPGTPAARACGNTWDLKHWHRPATGTRGAPVDRTTA